MYIIHIGSPKTGSTLIQDFLHDKRDALDALDLSLPLTGWARGRGHYAIRESLNRSADGVEYYENIRSEFSSFAKNQKNIVISSEALWTVPPKSLLRVYPFLKSAKVVFYCREQYSLIKSHYFQKIKGAGETRSFYDFFLDERENYEYDKILNKWEDVFGAGNVFPMLYEKSAREGGIVLNFLKFVQYLLDDSKDKKILSLLEGFDNSKRSNVKLPDIIAALLLVVNRIEVDEYAKKRLYNSLVGNKDIFGDLSFSGINLEESKKADLVEYYRKGNISIFERFFGGEAEYLKEWQV